MSETDAHPAIAVLPTDVAAARREFAQAAELQAQGKHSKAIDRYMAALRFAPNHAGAMCNLGASLLRVGRSREAVGYLRYALAGNTDHAVVRLNLARAFADLGRVHESEIELGTILDADPDNVAAWSLLGRVVRAQGRLSEAMAHFDRTIELDPKHPEAGFERGYTLLLAGEFERGFAEYEGRWLMRTARKMKNERPRWDGTNPAGKTILVRGEQGLGDNIQFCRYVPMLANRGARVILECRPELRQLFETLAGAELLVDYRQPLPEHDFWVPLLSLPSLFGTTLRTVPADVPYLSVPAGIEVRMSDFGDRLRVGVCWAGSPSHLNNRNRSTSVSPFLHLLESPDVAFLNLQQGKPAAEVETHYLAGIMQGDANQLKSMAETAALIARLDLVISVDTGVAHLAGALGVPVWVAVPNFPDWRWMLGRSDSPWYPTMRLFRQRRWGDWDGVFDEISAALAERVRLREQHTAERYSPAVKSA